MAKTPNPINVIGQPSEATVQFGAMRNNRILTAMQEQGAMQRQQQAGQTNAAIAGMSERGAMERAKMGEAGANKRAELSAQTAKEGQQSQVQMSEAQIAASDRQQAAMIRANRERDEFNANLTHELKTIDQDFENARFEKQRALAEGDMKRYETWAQKENDLNWVNSMMQFSLGAMNLRMTMGMIEKMAGVESAREALLSRRQEMSRNFQAKTQTFAAIDGQIDRALQSAAPTAQNAAGLLQAVTTAAQVPVSLDLFAPGNRDKLEQEASGWDVSQSYAIRTSLMKTRDALLVAKKTRATTAQPGDTKQGYGGFQMVTQSSGRREADVKAMDATIKQLDDALGVLDYDLPRSTRQIPNTNMTLGQQMTAYKLAHNGLTAEALADMAQWMYPDDNQGFASILEQAYRSPMTVAYPMMPAKFRDMASPEALQMFNSIWDALGVAVPGLRTTPTAQGPAWMPGVSGGTQK